MHRHESPAEDVSRDPWIRRDPLSGLAVFVAPDRERRPFTVSAAATSDGFVADCPFCAGNERLTPPDVMRVADDAGGWRARIIPNRYPFVRDRAESPNAPATAPGGGSPAHGVHEVVVESPRHERSILAVAPDCWEAVWRLCRDRLAALSVRPDLSWATVFKNSGALAGASLEHVHSQLVAIDFVPATIRTELAIAAAEPASFDRMVRGAEERGRIIDSSGGLVAFAPPAPRQPFETWIVPRGEGGSFAAAEDGEVAAVARLTRSVIARLRRIVPDADYNWWLHQAPFDHATGPDAAKGYRWHLEIVPRLASLAGFELGTGCHITTVPPEESARLLSEA